ncbi:MAG: pyrrolo-quinoline quinone, partial [Acidobacteria bacterium]|nr:pyrrolo-quinoline quinone [Acidobacteriota bacterium]
FNPANNNAIYQQVNSGVGGAVFSMPAYFNQAVYYGAVGDSLKSFPISGARLATAPSSQTGNSFPYPGATPSISANGRTNGIVWAAENGSQAVLHAYDAGNLSHEFYNSNQAGGRDQFGAGNKFITPIIANGRVYLGTTNGVAAFGNLK